MNQQTVRQVFGLAVRIIGVWFVLHGTQTLIAGFLANGNASMIMLGVLVASLGLGVVRYAEKIVRFAYPPDAPTDQPPA